MAQGAPPDWAEILEVNMKVVLQSLERERCANSLFFPGTYDPSLQLMLINPMLTKKTDFSLVFLHEYIHFVQGQTHWGEAIRRLDHLQVQMSVLLVSLRGKIIKGFMRNKLGREPAIEDLDRINASAEFRAGIRSALTNDSLFMQALRWIDDAEKRKMVLASQWTKIQEGFAYWACLSISRAAYEFYGNAAGVTRVAEISSRLTRVLLPNQAEGYQVVSEMAKTLSGDFSAVNSVIYVCLSPHFEKIPFLDLSLAELEMMVADVRYSPDERLRRAYKLVTGHDYDPTHSLQDLAGKLDQDDVPMLTIDAFNKYWYDCVDAHPQIVALMNALYSAIGLDFGYSPIAIAPGNSSVTIGKMAPVIQDILSLPAIPLRWPFSVMETFDQLHQTEILQLCQQYALIRDYLMRMAREEELLK